MNMTEFSFDPENGGMFRKWFGRYKDLFESDTQDLEAVAKVRLLMRKLNAQSHNRYANYILPKLPKVLSFEETVETLTKIFGPQSSIFSKRYRCLQLVKSEADDIINYAAKVSRACEDFEFHNMKADQFKCLVFVCGLKGHSYADIRAKLLSRMDSETSDSPVTMQHLFDEYQRLVNLKAEAFTIEQQPSSFSLHWLTHCMREGEIVIRNNITTNLGTVISKNKLQTQPKNLANHADSAVKCI